jgi:hypothetical protein
MMSETGLQAAKTGACLTDPVFTPLILQTYILSMPHTGINQEISVIYWQSRKLSKMLQPVFLRVGFSVLRTVSLNRIILFI